MSITLYGLSNCDSCRKARRALDQGGVTHRFIDLRADASDADGRLDATLVERFFACADWETLLNRRSTTWRNLDPEQRDGLDEARARRLVGDHPTLLKRPLLDTGNELIIGFDAEAYDRLR
ncbi:ArsC/Spx/MgsR family protein [Halotalea alkalilenta]|uniref:ArsC/Spx/MgsR family protein n=1 Tax=Halotalea alkalilenta TaxID=376489 RepID=UPI000487F7A1|nr:ArsC/Spx/MgsR family protein [Halotalea alkalilenta]